MCSRTEQDRWSKGQTPVREGDVLGMMHPRHRNEVCAARNRGGEPGRGLQESHTWQPTGLPSGLFSAGNGELRFKNKAFGNPAGKPGQPTKHKDAESTEG